MESLKDWWRYYRKFTFWRNFEDDYKTLRLNAKVIRKTKMILLQMAWDNRTNFEKDYRDISDDTKKT